MKIKRTWGFVLSAWLLAVACEPAKKATQSGAGPSTNPPAMPGNNTDTRTDALLEDLLRQHPQYFDSLLAAKDRWGLQVIYTQIDREKDNSPVLHHYYYNVNSRQYFYPASTVKMPVAFLALEKLNELNKPGVTKDATMITGATYSGQTAVWNDPSSGDGRPSIAHYIKQIFLVSDNDAYNRLYEFLGQEYINEKLHKKGYKTAEFLHRLSLPLNEDQNRHTNPIQFLDDSGNVVYEQPMQFNKKRYSVRNEQMGTGYYSGGVLHQGPFNFSQKNRISLEDLHGVLQSVIFPSTVPAKQRFNLTESDYRFLYQYMSSLPAEVQYPAYDTTAHWPAYVKFLLYGSEPGPLPRNIRIFNKVGEAYGFLIDVAYVVDFDKNIEFMLSAVISCNTDGIYNDDRYDYDKVGFPFLKHLGQVVYDYELKRVRKQVPDLSGFKMVYDK
jgi:Beta-lactamase enzyme family